jgi:hypothetical protein
LLLVQCVFSARPRLRLSILRYPATPGLNSHRAENRS